MTTHQHDMLVQHLHNADVYYVWDPQRENILDLPDIHPITRDLDAVQALFPLRRNNSLTHHYPTLAQELDPATGNAEFIFAGPLLPLPPGWENGDTRVFQWSCPTHGRYRGTLLTRLRTHHQQRCCPAAPEPSVWTFRRISVSAPPYFR